MTIQDLIPAPVRHLLAMGETAARRLSGDTGEIGIVGAVILAAGLAAAALALVAAITGKKNAFISQIPG